MRTGTKQKGMEGLKKEKRMAKERKLAEIFQSPLFVLWDIDDALKQIRKRYEIDLALDNIIFNDTGLTARLTISQLDNLKLKQERKVRKDGSGKI